ncbi:anthranilate synthase component I [Guptibacillus hwajinpoensis]|uniref:Anthranilate synthase component 1 n=1 Tax=Guptibacillus hwajinpoensis TaxID=208199 RepID=A0ABU0JY08_9BACL|nr:anthranilate synthase component I [Alkalihalobacillus hemicentroti]MDQ0481982.1 anthranilate synthase component 1 [Alkalihalobacillus hemicentroti]
MTTDYSSFKRDAESYGTIPLMKSYFLDTTTPIQIFQNIGKRASFLLESSDQESKWSRYSFIGVDPVFSLIEHQGIFKVVDADGNSILKRKDFESGVEALFEYLNPKLPDTSFPFYGGAVGYIGYDAVSQFDKVPAHPHRDEDVPLFHFIVCENLLIYDHHLKRLTVCHHARLNENSNVEQVYTNAFKVMEELVSISSKQTQGDAIYLPDDSNEEVDFSQIKSNYEKHQFLQDVEKIKKYIEEGDVFQAVLSQRFEKDVSISGLDLYRVLRIINPSPYMFYLKMNNVEIIGSSPEKLVQVRDGKVEIDPIAGTRKRGKTDEEDQALAEELLLDEKERAEHYMLVDLARNDVGRVSEYGSVDVPQLMDIGKFSHVMHIISKVTGVLASRFTSLDAVVASFPAGTVSGAPKVRAMQILNELEPTSRSIYSGAIGYIGFDGNIDSCIAIRTMVIKDGTAYVQAGAGVVADSIPENEWEETRNKASALIKAIQVAEAIFEKKEERLNV